MIDQLYFTVYLSHQENIFTFIEHHKLYRSMKENLQNPNKTISFRIETSVVSEKTFYGTGFLRLFLFGMKVTRPVTKYLILAKGYRFLHLRVKCHSSPKQLRNGMLYQCRTTFQDRLENCFLEKFYFCIPCTVTSPFI